MWILNIDNNKNKNNLNSAAIFKSQKTTLKSRSIHKGFIQDRGKNFVFYLIKLLFAALAPTVAPYDILDQ